MQIANDMENEDLVYQPAVQFDFNFGHGRKVNDTGYSYSSMMNFNELNTENLKYHSSASKGFVYFQNQFKNGEW